MRVIAFVLCCIAYAGNASGITAKSAATIALLKRMPRKNQLSINATPVMRPEGIFKNGGPHVASWHDPELLQAIHEIAVKEGPVAIVSPYQKTFSPYAESIAVTGVRDFNAMLDEKSYFSFDVPYNAIRGTYFSAAQNRNPHTEVIVDVAENLEGRLFNMHGDNGAPKWHGTVTHKVDVMPTKLGTSADLSYFWDKNVNAWYPADVTLTRKHVNGDATEVSVNRKAIFDTTIPYGSPGSSKKRQTAPSVDARWQALEGFLFENASDIQVGRRIHQ